MTLQNPPLMATYVFLNGTVKKERSMNWHIKPGMGLVYGRWSITGEGLAVQQHALEIEAREGERKRRELKGGK